MIVFEPDKKFLSWLQEIKVGDTAYIVNARTLRPITPSMLSESQIQKANKKVVTISTANFSRKDGLEVIPKNQLRYRSWEGVLRIMPDLNWSLVNNISLELEDHQYIAPRFEIEFMVMLLVSLAEQRRPLTTVQVQSLVVKQILKGHSVIPGYTAIGDGDLAEEMMKASHVIQDVKTELKDVQNLLAQLRDRTGELHLISFYPEGDGRVSRDRLRSDEAHDPSKLVVFGFENLDDAATKLREYLEDLQA
jgi:hypothetical protein